MQSTVEILDDDWRRIARSHHGARLLATWRVREPALAQYLTLDALVQHGEDPGTMDALARLAPTDPVAAITLLRLVIPDLLRSVGALNDHSHTVDDLLALAWETIRSTQMIPAGAVIDTIRAGVDRNYRRLRAIDRPRSRPLDNDSDAFRESSTPGTPAAPARATAALHDAFRDRAISTDDFRLITRTRLVGDSIESFADEEGVTAATLARRRRCAEKVLRRRMTATCQQTERAA